MSDPIDKLTRLGDALEGAPMPLPASEIRARGDRIRRRKHAVIAGASAAVVAAVAAPVIALTTGGDDAEAPFTPRPSVSDPVPAAPLSAENLLTSDDAVYGTDGRVDWVAADTYPGGGQRRFSPCARSSLDALGAESVIQRDFDFVRTDTQEVDQTNHLNEIIAEFPTAADAEAAYDEIRGWYADCLPEGADRYDEGTFDTVPIGVDGTAEAQLSDYGPLDQSIDPFGDLGYFLETGLVLSGDRIAVLSQSIVGQDYNFEIDRRPVVQMLPAAAARLVIGGPGEAPAPPTDWPTVIPATFPLTSGWPQDDGSDEYRLEAPSSDNQAMIPAGNLQACVFSPVDPGALERLTTRLSYGSASYIRELELFPSDQEAVTYVDQLRALYQGCPTDDQNGTPPTFTTEVDPGSIGEQSVVITRASDSIGRAVINVVRVGNAVVVDLASDEGVGDSVADLSTVTRENLGDVIAAMNELQGGSTEPDLTAPATTREIPADFPLDAVVDGEAPAPDSETTVDGPAEDVTGVQNQSICGEDAAFPHDRSIEPEDELGYAVSGIEYGDRRSLHVFSNVQEPVDRMAELRAQILGCDRDSGGDGLSNRLWAQFNSDTGYDSVTFGYTYEIKDGVGAPAGQLYTVVRVGNAILAIEWGAEYSTEAMAANAPDQVALAKVIGAEMCVFAAAGC